MTNYTYFSNATGGFDVFNRVVTYDGGTFMYFMIPSIFIIFFMVLNLRFERNKHAFLGASVITLISCLFFASMGWLTDPSQVVMAGFIVVAGFVIGIFQPD